MNDLRTSIIINLTGNVEAKSRRFGKDIERMGQRGSRALNAMHRGLSMVGRGLDRLGNRYTAAIFGAGGIATVRMVANLEQRFTRLGIQAGESAEQMAKFKKEIFETAQAANIRIDPNQLTAAVNEIVESTGDLKFAKENLRNLGIAIQATGASGQAIGGLAAELEKRGIKKPGDVLKALDILDLQGKKGAFTLENLASLGPRVFPAYATTGRTGLTSVREMGAALQVIRQATGSAEEAATSFEALLRVFNDPQKLKMLQAGGIKVYDQAELKKGNYVKRPINELMEEIVKRAKGRMTTLSKVIGDQEALRAFNALVGEYQRTGSMSSMDKFYDVVANGTTIMSDSARAAREFNAALTNLNTAYTKFADKTLAGKVQGAADVLNGQNSDNYMETGYKLLKTYGLNLAGRKLLGSYFGPLPSALYAMHEFGLEPLGLGITGMKKHWEEFKTDWAAVTDVLSGKRDWRTGKLLKDNGQDINAASVKQTQQVVGKITVSFDDNNRPRVTNMSSSANLDLNVDTGRMMAGH